MATHEDIILTKPENEDALQHVIDESQDPLPFAADSPDQVRELPLYTASGKSRFLLGGLSFLDTLIFDFKAGKLK